MANSLTVEQTCLMFNYISKKIIENKPLLTEVDGAIGDGDHGIGMSVGFTAASKRLNETELSSINDIFKTTGMAMINSMGGASGVIFGTMFLGGVKKAPLIEQLNLESLTRICESALKEVKLRGKAEIGDKTMVDALEPAVEALKESVSQSLCLIDGLKSAEKSAKEGVEKTKEQYPKFGRAKTLGERAIGHQDAGATSVWIIFRSMREWVEKNKN
ncbi:dihydroxyacetone kinase subunit DhaL [Alkalihalobacillus sp. MEB130]|uniref:dihydroxyacetone kinase subunit DhaL n=1 Tax=Alkalihalobacillus sp. MEB130 TaxID=2976704 RepID=UPI0028E01011|nr:dihydroxyacetone kinase subunit DhaL [Alkalihalobacillus sp. MEB130]MDT8862973.1 dihydroxyacetone kinase subunit DhaL [Alkalihalobacillus sp. MEB130]